MAAREIEKARNSIGASNLLLGLKLAKAATRLAPPHPFSEKLLNLLYRNLLGNLL